LIVSTGDDSVDSNAEDDDDDDDVVVVVGHATA